MKTTTQSAPALSTGRNFTTSEAMSLLGYDDRTAFWQAVKRAGLPYIRVSARRAVFRESALVAWMDAREIGAPVRITAKSGGAA